MNSFFNIFSFLILNSKKDHQNWFNILVRSIYYKFKYGKYIFTHPKCELYGIENIEFKKVLHIGTISHELNHRDDLTKINIKGNLLIESELYHIGRGCRIDVAKNTILKVGKGGFINPFTNIIVRNGVEIGDNCYVSWNCLILDEDYHQINYEGKTLKDKKIFIGNHVWVGTGVSIYQGTHIADGCVVAANSVVRGEFNIPNCIIAGNPAKIIKKNISWS